MKPHIKKSQGVNIGERTGHPIDPYRQIQRLGKYLSKRFRTPMDK